MTALIWHISGDRTVIATDSRWWNEAEDAPGELVSKLYPIPVHNAVIAGGTWFGVIYDVIGRLTALQARDTDHLLERLTDVVREAWERFQAEAPSAGVKPDFGPTFWFMTPGAGWIVGYENDFEPTPLPTRSRVDGVWCDPQIDGSALVKGKPQGDQQIVDLMRRQRTAKMKPNGSPISGFVTRATISRDGIEIRRIGDLESEARPPATATARKPGRNDPCPCGSGRKHKRCCAS